MSRCTHGGINDGEDCGICASEATLCAELAGLRDENARLKEALRALVCSRCTWRSLQDIVEEGETMPQTGKGQDQ